ncbi:cytochrome P450, partial [Paracoccaceae bacterium]|nr:cytochrome P450 [Paracoccaceae bacterium]
RIENNSMLELEGERHRRLRGLVLRAFTTKNIQSISHSINKLCSDLVSKFDQDEIDLVERYARQVPVITIARLLGVPEEMSDQILKWSNTMVSMYQADVSEKTRRLADKSSKEFFHYIAQYVNERRLKPGDDLITHLINSEENNKKLNFDELVSTCILLLNAGHEATVHTIGNGIKAILENNINNYYLSDENLPMLIEEILRYDPPLHIFNRYAYVDLVINGISIKKGEKINLVIGASGRDLNRWQSPSKFIPNRVSLANNSFGAGRHFCLGASLARMEVGLALKNLFRNHKNFSTLNTLKYANIYHFHGLESLTVSLN